MTTNARHLFDTRLQFVSTVDYGFTQAQAAAGVPIPEEGVRFDVFFEGTVRGEHLQGRISGIDYVTVGSDGVSRLHVHAHITTDDGSHIALHAEGLAHRRENSYLADTRESLSLSTAAERYRWLNGLRATAIGVADMQAGSIDITVTYVPASSVP